MLAISDPLHVLFNEYEDVTNSCIEPSLGYRLLKTPAILETPSLLMLSALKLPSYAKDSSTSPPPHYTFFVL
jgi:hypothetical protein